MVAAAAGTNLCDRELAIIFAPEWIGVMALFRVKPTLIDEVLRTRLRRRRVRCRKKLQAG